MAAHTKLLDAERSRLASLERSTVEAPGPGEVLNVGASVGRHVSAGDTLARMVDCRRLLHRRDLLLPPDGSDLEVGTRVTIDAGAAGIQEGTISEVLPKTSDKVDETYAVPFPQTERRELYVLVSPDHPLRSAAVSGGQDFCDIGHWVTVTRANGWVPSLSVLWRTGTKWLASRAEAVAKSLPTQSGKGNAGVNVVPYGALAEVPSVPAKTRQSGSVRTAVASRAELMRATLCAAALASAMCIGSLASIGSASAMRRSERLIAPPSPAVDGQRPGGALARPSWLSYQPGPNEPALAGAARDLGLLL